MKTNPFLHPLHVIFGVFFIASACSSLGEGMFYIGSGIGLENFNARYDKRADTNLFPTLSLSDLVFNERDADEGTPYTFNAFTGFRFELITKGLWFGVQAETVLKSDVFEGRVSGVGRTTDGTQIENVLPEDWTLRTDRDRSLVIRTGTVVSFLGILDFSPYVIAGLREVDVAFERKLEVCGTKLVCQPEEQSTTAIERHNPSLRHLVIGFGIEKFIGEKTSISFEARYSSEDEDKWDGSTNEISTPNSLSTDSYDLSLKFSLYL